MTSEPSATPPAGGGSAPLPEAALRSADERGPRRRTRHRDRTWLKTVEYVVLRGVLTLLGALPLRCAYWIAEMLVRAFLTVVPRYRERTLAHLDIAYGDTRDAAWKRELLWTCHRYLAWYFVDVLLAPRLLADARRAERVDISQFEEVLRRDAITTDRGALLVAAHQGSPEIGSLVAAVRGWPNAVILRPLDNPRLWAWLRGQRSHIPQQAIDKHGGLRVAHRVLRRKGIVGIQIDQDATSKGLFVPYFGRLASTHAGAASLALMSSANVYFLTCLRTQPRRFGYRMRLEGPLRFTPSGDQQQDVLALTTLMTQGTERMVRACPEQVMWAHRRWKSRPPGETA